MELTKQRNMVEEQLLELRTKLKISFYVLLKMSITDTKGTILLV
jgi:hypothetical protein